MNFENVFLLGFRITLLPGARFTEAFQILFTSNVENLNKQVFGKMRMFGTHKQE